VLAEPIIRLLYQRGRFDAGATAGTAAALSFYAVGLVAYTAVKVLAPAFYALGTPRVALVASALAVGTNLTVNLSLFRAFGFRAVALGTALGSIVNASFLAFVFERRMGGLRGHHLPSLLGRMALAAGAMAPACYFAARLLEARFGTHGLRAQMLGGLAPVAIGVVVYGLAAWVLKVPQATMLVGLLKRRLAR
jgi:putative peptidoglycan lipid II flippase